MNGEVQGMTWGLSVVWLNRVQLRSDSSLSGSLCSSASCHHTIGDCKLADETSSRRGVVRVLQIPYPCSRVWVRG